MDYEQFILLQQMMLSCRRCIDEGFLVEPGAIFSGNIAAEVLLIGQAPGITEVSAQRPFNAGSGQRLFQWLNDAGFSESTFRQYQYMTAVTKCYPGKNNSGKGDRVPSRREQRLCRPYLEQELLLINPKVIIPVGSLAIQLFFDKAMILSDVIGKAAFWEGEISGEWPRFPNKNANLETSLPVKLNHGGRWIVPLPHPSGASLWPNRPENQELIHQAIRLLGKLRTRLGLQGGIRE